MQEFNFVTGKNVRQSDIESLFNPGDEIESFPYHWEYPDLLAHIKIFKSKSDARKNGWNKPIPNGFTDFRIGKLKNRITILKIPGAEDILELIVRSHDQAASKYRLGK